jgi:hypothetical protein
MHLAFQQCQSMDIDSKKQIMVIICLMLLDAAWGMMKLSSA